MGGGKSLILGLKTCFLQILLVLDFICSFETILGIHLVKRLWNKRRKKFSGEMGKLGEMSIPREETVFGTCMVRNCQKENGSKFKNCCKIGPINSGALKQGPCMCSTFKAFNLTYLHVLCSKS